MRRRTTNPLILIATVIALAIGAWWTNEDRAVQSPAPASRPAPVEPDAAPKPSAEPEDRLAQLVPDSVERAELVKTLDLIERGGPFPHKQDGSVFGNRERQLPQQPRGYYHEYTVRTPGAPNRGARRVVRGDGGELYYTRDHYRTFIRL
ncbi:MAG TPA: ribonuclease domain-containing protein [Thermoanaerobaculia bacterium]|nr:ribonuclease domain-containing protein [Thermoanaerobaculia bacterium]